MNCQPFGVGWRGTFVTRGAVLDSAADGNQRGVQANRAHKKRLRPCLLQRDGDPDDAHGIYWLCPHLLPEFTFRNQCDDLRRTLLNDRPVARGAVHYLGSVVSHADVPGGDASSSCPP